MFVDNAMALVRGAFPAPDAAMKREALANQRRTNQQRAAAHDLQTQTLAPGQ